MQGRKCKNSTSAETFKTKFGGSSGDGGNCGDCSNAFRIINFYFMLHAIFEPISALFNTNLILASRLRPSVKSFTRDSRNGVVSFPLIPSASASLMASSITAFISSAGISSSAGIGQAVSYTHLTLPTIA